MNQVHEHRYNIYILMFTTRQGLTKQCVIYFTFMDVVVVLVHSRSSCWILCVIGCFHAYYILTWDSLFLLSFYLFRDGSTCVAYRLIISTRSSNSAHSIYTLLKISAHLLKNSLGSSNFRIKQIEWVLFEDLVEVINKSTPFPK